ncbi:MAG TPA: universal stress protein [Frankiaceae bacterium]|nr:universal stress protein [Frankiaceae bacterium]
MGRIVVGVDGSDTGLVALRWALDEAALRHWPVVAVHAYETPLLGIERDSTRSPVLDLAPSAYDLTEEQVRRARAAGRGRAVPVEIVVAEGHAAGVLADVALDDDLLVVGSRGRGGLAELVLGSTSHRVAAHAGCPVVVVRPEAAG